MSQKIVAIIFPGVTSAFNIFFTGNVEYFNTTDSISVSGPLNMEPIGCPEMSITSYQSMLCNIPEGQRSHLHRTGSMKSHTMKNVFHVDRWPILPLSVTITRPFGKSQHHFCTWWIDITLDELTWHLHHTRPQAVCPCSKVPCFMPTGTG
jgi:hypothetical protein